jgi:outer membrane beta-barrel protein
MNTKMKNLLLITLIAAAFTGSKALAQNANQSSSETEIQESPQSEAPPPQEIKIDEDELPGESVVPKTDTLQSVINKKIRFTKRFMVNVSAGSVLDEPIVNANYFLFRGTYHTNEDYSFGFGFRSRFGNRTDYSQQLYEGSAQLEFDRAPAPSSASFLSFGYTFYYGKMSFAKNAVIPATTSMDADAGLQRIGTADKPFVQAGVTQSFYLTKSMAVGLTYGLSLAQSVDPTSVNIRSTSPNPKESDFSDKLQFNQFLSANLSFLL